MTGPSGNCYLGSGETKEWPLITSDLGTKDLWLHEHVDFDAETFLTQDTDVLSYKSHPPPPPPPPRLDDDIQFHTFTFFFQKGDNAEGYHALS